MCKNNLSTIKQAVFKTFNDLKSHLEKNEILFSKEQIIPKLNSLINTLFSKKAILFVLSVLALFVVYPVLEKYLLIPLAIGEQQEYRLLDYGVLALCMFLFGFSLHKSYIRYRLSFNQLQIGILLLGLYYLMTCSDQLECIKISFKPLEAITYLSAIYFSVYTFVGFRAVFWIWDVILIPLYDYFLEEQNSAPSYLFEDVPIQSEQKFNDLVTRLEDAVKQHYDGSFSIGLIGPWGHGKTTFIRALKNRLKHQTRKKEILEVNFSPFLNHKKDEIIVEFFTALSEQLSRYSGRLAKSLKDYSNSLVKLYKNQEITDILSNQNSIHGKSAHELYEEINAQIGVVNKKIVVYVDDVDRLNADEILEVLKLIRNTSNFSNTIFILAFDKGYVIKALSEERKYMAKKYVDKFFQLEVYLPEIQTGELRNYLNELLKNSSGIEPRNYLMFEDAINSEELLFSDFVKNYRDVIRLANQIIYEHNLVKDLFIEVDLTDCINLIFLKTNYPLFFQEIYNNRSIYLHLDNGTYSLKKIGASSDNSYNTGYDQKNLFAPVFKSENIPYNEYEVYHVNNDTKRENRYTQEELFLLIKTLHRLFESKSTKKNPIRLKRNLDKVLRFSYAENDLLDSEFESLLNPKRTNYISYLNGLLEIEKGNQILNKLEIFPVSSKDEIKKVAIILFHLFVLSNRYRLDYPLITRLLATYLNVSREDQETAEYIIPTEHRLDKEETKTFFQEEFLEQDCFTSSDKLSLIFQLEENKKGTQLWGFDDQELLNKAIDLYQKFLDEHSENYWALNDFTFQRFYYKICYFAEEGEQRNKVKEQLNEKLKQFLNANNLPSFCAQMVKSEYGYDLSYQVDELLVNIFPKNDFIGFIQNKIKNDSSELQEFLSFYRLMEITSFEKDRYFKYVFSNEIFINRVNQALGRQNTKISYEQKGLVQVFIRFNKELWDFDPNFNELSWETRSIYYFRDEKSKIKHLFAGIITSDPYKFENDIMKIIYDQLFQYKGYNKEDKNVLRLQKRMPGQSSAILDRNNENLVRSVSNQNGYY